MAAPVFHMLAAAPSPVAPFSHAVECDGWILVTGQMPTDPHDDGAPLPDGVQAQTRRVMDNLVIVLDALGLGLEHVLQARVYLTCFKLLTVLGNPEAKTWLHEGQTWIDQRAAALSDPTLRNSFLNHVPSHREIKARCLVLGN